MIGYIRGTLLHKDPPVVVVDVGGLGYEVEAPASTWARLPALGAPVELRTHLVIREDQHLLFGFATEGERQLFRDLLKVNGVGARTALAILSGISVEDLIRSVQGKDIATLTKVPGVGRKTAERLILDLRDRGDAMASAGLVATASAAATGGTTDEVYDALVALGYKPAAARRMLAPARPESAGSSTADLLRAALKSAAPQ